MNGDGDPEKMDGRAIACRLHKHVTDPARNWENVAFWSGVAIAKLLEQERALEAAGLVPATAWEPGDDP